MIDLGKLFDSYSRQARLYPALLTVLPATAAALAWYPRLSLPAVGGFLLTIATSCGLIFFLADVARTRGKKLEPQLLASWGGWPTTLWLRHGDEHLPPPVKERYHSYLSEHAGSGNFPTAQQEIENPGSAHDIYASAVMWLKEQTRDDALVNKENATYGFRRNLLGMKSTGLTLSVLALATTLIASAAFHYPSGMSLTLSGLGTAIAHAGPGPNGAVMFALISCVAWLLVVRPQWVREAGDQYARALLAACDSPPSKKGGKKKAKQK